MSITMISGKIAIYGWEFVTSTYIRERCFQVKSNQFLLLLDKIMEP